MAGLSNAGTSRSNAGMQPANDPPDLSALVGAAAERRRLLPRADLHETGWSFWELRNVNMHRVVGLFSVDRAPGSSSDLEAQIRDAIGRNFKRAWWRGLAYGVVVKVSAGAWTPEDLEPMVDVRESRRGVLQWLLIAAPDGRSAVGVHTWEQVYLSQVYRETVQALDAAGCRVATAVKGKGGLLTFLTDVAELRGVEIPEFHDQS